MAFIAPRVFLLNKGKLVIQSAQINDAADIIHMIQQTEEETDFLTRVPGEVRMTVEDEYRFIEDKLSNPKEIFVTARYNGKLVGTLGFSTSRYVRYNHKGEFGISILKDYWGLGIGKKLIETLIEWADSNGIIKITLEVDTLNKRAVQLYKSFGFFEEGFLKMDRFMENQEFRDSYIMARFNPYHRSL
jgi:RimJ/RimL family protein N-acetyltransferase